MKILAIETSCDETSAAVVEDGIKIKSVVISSSQSLHEKTGGIIPEAAAREQIKFIIPVLETALNEASTGHLKDFYTMLMSEIDALAVTIGPGLIGSLLIGIETAKTISFVTKKKLIPVNHIHAHIYANWLDPNNLPKFPAIALVVSGGHTELFLMKSHTDIKWIGGTLDDAAGEAFDKTARILGLGYPGGPAIAAASAQYQKSKIKNKKEIILPRPMMHKDSLDFSFSGLKTAVMREVEKLKKERLWNTETIHQLAYEIQEAITDVLVRKTLSAAAKYKVSSVLLGGGVAANQRLKEKFNSQITNYQLPIALHIPIPSLCTDNAAYIGSFAYFHNNPLPYDKIQAQPDLAVEV